MFICTVVHPSLVEQIYSGASVIWIMRTTITVLKFDLLSKTNVPLLHTYILTKVYR